MRRFRALATGAAAAVLSLGLAACGSSTPTPVGSPAAEGGAPAAGAAFPRTVKHAMGETKIPAQPKRVVALDQSFVDAVLSLETELIGFTEYRSIAGKLPSYLDSVQGHAAQAVTVGTLESPSLEKIISLKPDLIVSAKVRHEALYAKLSQIAPTVFGETTGAIWKDNIRLVGQAVGKEDLADQTIAKFEQRAAAIGKSIAGAGGGTMPAVSVVRFVDEPTARLYVENSYSGIVLKDVGFRRPEGQPTTTDTINVDISEERILDLDADHIFIAVRIEDGTDKNATGDKFMANPLWGRLKGKKHDVSDTTWMSAVGLQGAHAMLDDLAKLFNVDPAKA
ncbi:ABC transporter substrate-binding protein [Rhizohabitans arisaemae]|uniref:ABC transporter substrate-binding protein n=1 Tax=Rhizohabitans arisaemae TaxID=2720610 RepID=UPI0024B20E68|nr:iron-siderophore ABC transporter substrate-binding protein [Rhizohabitans arisaemae]